MTNEVKNVPELRFPNFSEEWKKFVFKDQIISIEKGTDLLGSEDNMGIPLIKMGNIKRGYFSFNKLEKLRESETIQEKYYIKKGDFLFNTRNTMELVGKSATWTNKSDKFAFNSNIARIVLKDIDTYFFNYLYNTSKMINKVKSLAVGTTSVAAIYPRDLNHLNYFLPLIAEQEKIGEFFSKLDRQIELEEQKLAKLEEQKKGYMQKLFSQEIRFKDNQGNNYPDWKIVEIGDILEERTERSGEGDMLSVTINNGIIKFDEIDRKDNSSKDKSNYRKVYKDDIAYNSMRMWQGASGKSEYEGIVSPAYTVTIPSENINPDFIAYYFKTHKMIHKFKINSQGLTSDTWNLKYRQLKDIKLNLCSKEEQNKIANLLIMYDKLINKQKHKLEILKTNKKGFLQKMFV